MFIDYMCALQRERLSTTLYCLLFYMYETNCSLVVFHRSLRKRIAIATLLHWEAHREAHAHTHQPDG